MAEVSRASAGSSGQESAPMLTLFQQVDLAGSVRRKELTLAEANAWALSVLRSGTASRATQELAAKGLEQLMLDNQVGGAAVDHGAVLAGLRLVLSDAAVSAHAFGLGLPLATKLLDRANSGLDTSPDAAAILACCLGHVASAAAQHSPDSVEPAAPSPGRRSSSGNDAPAKPHPDALALAATVARVLSTPPSQSTSPSPAASAPASTPAASSAVASSSPVGLRLLKRKQLLEAARFAAALVVATAEPSGPSSCASAGPSGQALPAGPGKAQRQGPGPGPFVALLAALLGMPPLMRHAASGRVCELVTAVAEAPGVVPALVSVLHRACSCAGGLGCSACGPLSERSRARGQALECLLALCSRGAQAGGPGGAQPAAAQALAGGALEPVLALLDSDGALAPQALKLVMWLASCPASATTTAQSASAAANASPSPSNGAEGASGDGYRRVLAALGPLVSGNATVRQRFLGALTDLAKLEPEPPAGRLLLLEVLAELVRSNPRAVTCQDGSFQEYMLDHTWSLAGKGPVGSTPCSIASVRLVGLLVQGPDGPGPSHSGPKAGARSSGGAGGSRASADEEPRVGPPPGGRVGATSAVRVLATGAYSAWASAKAAAQSGSDATGFVTYRDLALGGIETALRACPGALGAFNSTNGRQTCEVLTDALRAAAAGPGPGTGPGPTGSAEPQLQQLLAHVRLAARLQTHVATLVRVGVEHATERAAGPLLLLSYPLLQLSAAALAAALKGGQQAMELPAGAKPEAGSAGPGRGPGPDAPGPVPLRVLGSCVAAAAQALEATTEEWDLPPDEDDDSCNGDGECEGFLPPDLPGLLSEAVSRLQRALSPDQRSEGGLSGGSDGALLKEAVEAASQVQTRLQLRQAANAAHQAPPGPVFGPQPAPAGHPQAAAAVDPGSGTSASTTTGNEGAAKGGDAWAAGLAFNLGSLNLGAQGGGGKGPAAAGLARGRGRPTQQPAARGESREGGGGKRANIAAGDNSGAAAGGSGPSHNTGPGPSFVFGVTPPSPFGGASSSASGGAGSGGPAAGASKVGFGFSFGSCGAAASSNPFSPLGANGATGAASSGSGGTAPAFSLGAGAPKLPTPAAGGSASSGGEGPSRPGFRAAGSAAPGFGISFGPVAPISSAGPSTTGPPPPAFSGFVFGAAQPPPSNPPTSSAAASGGSGAPAFGFGFGPQPFSAGASSSGNAGGSAAGVPSFGCSFGPQPSTAGASSSGNAGSSPSGPAFGGGLSFGVSPGVQPRPFSTGASSSSNAGSSAAGAASFGFGFGPPGFGAGASSSGNAGSSAGRPAFAGLSFGVSPGVQPGFSLGTGSQPTAPATGMGSGSFAFGTVPSGAFGGGSAGPAPSPGFGLGSAGTSAPFGSASAAAGSTASAGPGPGSRSGSGSDGAAESSGSVPNFADPGRWTPLTPQPDGASRKAVRALRQEQGQRQPPRAKPSGPRTASKAASASPAPAPPPAHARTPQPAGRSPPPVDPKTVRPDTFGAAFGSLYLPHFQPVPDPDYPPSKYGVQHYLQSISAAPLLQVPGWEQSPEELRFGDYRNRATRGPGVGAGARPAPPPPAFMAAAAAVEAGWGARSSAKDASTQATEDGGSAAFLKAELETLKAQKAALAAELATETARRLRQEAATTEERRNAAAERRRYDSERQGFATERRSLQSQLEGERSRSRRLQADVDGQRRLVEELERELDGFRSRQEQQRQKQQQAKQRKQQRKQQRQEEEDRSRQQQQQPGQQGRSKAGGSSSSYNGYYDYSKQYDSYEDYSDEYGEDGEDKEHDGYERWYEETYGHKPPGGGTGTGGGGFSWGASGGAKAGASGSGFGFGGAGASAGAGGASSSKPGTGTGAGAGPSRSGAGAGAGFGAGAAKPPPPKSPPTGEQDAAFAASQPPTLDDTTPVRVLRQFLTQAGADAAARTCTEKAEFLALARERLNAWHVRRAAACSRLPASRGDRALFWLGPGAPVHKEALARTHKDLALRLHPDKNPGDPLATAAFQYLQAAHGRVRVLAT
ncbi:hypothetical protein HYH03_011335 [Edaphochlamys debaryana]|uniref:J domain-containing protein n=1 Tax=Edaphochlamys debaryana TaxID=47281 RepID=A0A835XW92_9CHLO|nr:hypothetical protein HYH03_011335 [Edaphochlamys debaryana]|eukprot:KAG2490208.1 hypothetical protein HYH03_011335 [Edaphochlamys debaryana]